MDRLILFRHGKAETDAPSGRDFDRRLTGRGVKESAGVGEALAELGLVPDLALVSPAARAKETWEAAAPAFPDARLELDPELYHADPYEIRRAAELAGKTARCVCVVGHNPGLQELTVLLLIEGNADRAVVERAQRNFPTAAAAVFLIDAEGRPAYDGLFYPER
jgi:phosphohistidine phosphatase